MSRQQNAMMELLHDNNAHIRAKACLEVLNIIKEFYGTLELNFKKGCLKWVSDFFVNGALASSQIHISVQVLFPPLPPASPASDHSSVRRCYKSGLSCR